MVSNISLCNLFFYFYINIYILTIVAGYYFLWRSAYSNSGLDSTYRDFFKKNNDISIDAVRSYLNDVLANKGINTKEGWMSKAKNNLKYDSTGKDVVRLALLIAAHDTIPDETNKGMIKVGREGFCDYLSLA